jgi:hypothetical protein
MLSGRDLDTYTDLRLLAPYVRERLASMDEASARAELDSICGSLQVLCETDK